MTDILLALILGFTIGIWVFACFIFVEVVKIRGRK